jgi:hypothetical protein
MGDLVWAKQRKLLRAADIGYNAEVYRHFKDTDGSASRTAVRDVCLIGAKDSRITAESKMRFFYERVLKVQYKPDVYALPNDEIKSRRRGRPKVVLHFSQFNKYSHHVINPDTDKPITITPVTPITGQISFRIMDETSDSMTKAKATTIANKIKSIFAGATPYKWDKGRTMFTYNQWDKGYAFKLLCATETDAKNLVTKVLDIQGHTPDWKRFNTVTNDDPLSKYPENPGTEIIMGETVKQERERPVETVQFRYAYMTLEGRRKPVSLVDTTYKLKEVLAA